MLSGIEVFIFFLFLTTLSIEIGYILLNQPVQFSAEDMLVQRFWSKKPCLLHKSRGHENPYQTLFYLHQVDRKATAISHSDKLYFY